ncbi:TraX family protein [Caproicibacter sp. BJN0012]|uniref:TraX family protein n=1 Tax=Caproicibacter sp. BJN0012 TaxID=3110227 RepID=UPI002E0DFD28
MEQPARGLTANAVKWIAIAAMLIDHIAWGFVPTYSALGQLMHIVGRITAPTMCFFLAEGYAHTHSFRKYAFRLGAFALISQVPFTLFETGKLQFIVGGNSSETLNVIYTLFLSLLAIRACDRINSRKLRFLAVFGLCLLSLPGDWMFFDILFALSFWQNRGELSRQIQSFSILAVSMVLAETFLSVSEGYPIYSQLFQFGVLLCLPVLILYNGRRGGGRTSKWTFYIFYPAHLLALGLLKIYLAV